MRTYTLSYDGTGFYRVTLFHASGIVSELSIHFRDVNAAKKYMSQKYPSFVLS